MDLSTTSLILTGLVTIVFLVAVILSYKTWKVYTILLVLLNFMAGICFFYYAVRTLKTHKEWRETAAVFEVGLERFEKDNHELVEGKRDEDGKLLIAGIKWNELWLHRLALTRGRVWEGCQPGTVDATTGAVSVTVPAGGDHVEIESPAADGTGGKAEIVYVFEDADVEAGGRYIGEFNVVKRTDGDGDSEIVFDLVPTRKVQGVELARIADRTRIKDEKGWVMYAVMPRDHRHVFSRLSLEDGEAKFTTLDEQTLRALDPRKAQVDAILKKIGRAGEDRLTQEVLKTLKAQVDAILEKISRAGEESLTQEELKTLEDAKTLADAEGWIAEYRHDMHAYREFARDMEELSEYLDIQIAEEGVLDEARKWVRVSFKEPDYKLNMIASHAILPISPAGEAVFELGVNYGYGSKWQIYLPQEMVQELGSDVVTQAGEVYVRELRDYEHLFHDYNRERASIATEIIDVLREKNYLIAARDKVDLRETMRKAEQVRLEADAANFVLERDGVTAYAARLDQHCKDILAEVLRLHFENQALAKELARLQLAAKGRLENKSPVESTSLRKKAAPGL